MTVLMQQLSEWLAHSPHRYCSVSAEGSWEESRYRCWLYDSGEGRRAEVFGTDPKTLAEVVAEALAEIQKRTEAVK